VGILIPSQDVPYWLLAGESLINSSDEVLPEMPCAF